MVSTGMLRMLGRLFGAGALGRLRSFGDVVAIVDKRPIADGAFAVLLLDGCFKQLSCKATSAQQLEIAVAPPSFGPLLLRR
jgi:hypothetical protein